MTRTIWIWMIFMVGFSDGNRNVFTHRMEFFHRQEGDRGDLEMDDGKPILEFDKTEMTLALNTDGILKMRSSTQLATDVNVTFSLESKHGEQDVVRFHRSHFLIPAGPNGTDWIEIRMQAIRVGHDRTLESNCTNVNETSIGGGGVCDLDVEDATIRLSVVHSIPLVTIIQIFGWVYFVAWSISFYPQIILNFRRKSVLGLNFDFLGLNLTGFLFYSLYNCAMFWIPVVQEEYEVKYPDGVNPVQVNDVVFALHALFATIITIAQCFVYEKGHQRVSKTCTGLLSIMWATAFVAMIVAAAKATTWLIFFDILSGIKLSITLVKYIPQAYYNYRRKSTAGWSIGNILLDFTGGSTSLIQMFLLAYNNDDWKEIFGDFTKFGLGAISLSFDVLFIFQHYIFYRHAIAYEPQNSVMDDDEDDDDDNGVVRDPTLGHGGIGGQQPTANNSSSIHVPYVDVNERR